jgi:hypothetical protein
MTLNSSSLQIHNNSYDFPINSKRSQSESELLSNERNCNLYDIPLSSSSASLQSNCSEMNSLSLSSCSTNNSSNRSSLETKQDVINQSIH